MNIAFEIQTIQPRFSPRSCSVAKGVTKHVKAMWQAGSSHIRAKWDFLRNGYHCNIVLQLLVKEIWMNAD